jgi:hypothetical protein
MIEAYVLAGELDRAAGHVEHAVTAFEARLRSFVTDKEEQRWPTLRHALSYAEPRCPRDRP